MVTYIHDLPEFLLLIFSPWLIHDYIQLEWKEFYYTLKVSDKQMIHHLTMDVGEC